MAAALPGGTIYRFGDFELDTRLHELRCEGERRHVEPQVFDVLSHLFACRDRLVTKDELLDKVWGHRYVAPTTLHSRIKHARQAVGDDGGAQRVIQTVRAPRLPRCRRGRRARVTAAAADIRRGARTADSVLHGTGRRADRLRDERHGTAARQAGELDHAPRVRLGKPSVAALDARALTRAHVRSLR